MSTFWIIFYAVLIVGEIACPVLMMIFDDDTGGLFLLWWTLLLIGFFSLPFSLFMTFGAA